MLRLRFALGLVALVALAVACTTEDGVTPSCTDRASCHPPPTCEIAPANPRACCVDEDGNELTGVPLEQCLIGFGVAASGGAGGSGADGGGGSGATGGSAGGSGGSGGTGGGGGAGGG